MKDIVSIWKMYKLFKKVQPDIIHSQSLKANLVAMIAGTLARVPIRIQTMAGLISTKDDSLKSRFFEKIEQLTFRLSTHVWPNSPSSYNHIINRKLCKPNKLQVIGYGSSNGIDLERFNRNVLDQNRLQAIKTNINYDKNCFYFLFVGRVVKDKGIVELVDAFKNLTSTTTNLKLIIVGPYEKEFDALPEETEFELENNEHIIKVGWSNEVEYYMALSNVFVFPSYREGFPNVLLQSAALKCPIICSAIIGNIDIVEDKKTGLLFKSQDTQDLFTKMKWSIENTALLNTMSHALYEKVVSQFDRKQFHQWLLEAYKKVLIKNE